MDFRILGPLEVEHDGTPLSLGSGRQLALVAVLLLHRNEVVSVDRLVEELWNGSPPPTAAKVVRNNVSLLRKELGDRLTTRPPGYLLRVEAGELDSDLFEAAIRDGSPAAVFDALALWRGRPLAEFAYDDFAQAEIARLEELWLAATEKRIDVELAEQRHAHLVPELERLVQEHPLRERLRGQLMLALYRSGRQAEALEAYQRARRALDEQLGIEPGPALRELERSILNQDPALGAPSIATVASSPRRRRTRAFAVGALVAAVAVLVAVGALLASRGGGSTLIVPPDHVGVIDPATRRVTSTIQVGVRPEAIAAGLGFLWVGNVDDQTLSRVDPRGGPTPVITLDRRTPTGVAVGAGKVWVALGRAGELSRVEPVFRQSEPMEVTEPFGAPYGSVVVDGADVWVVYGNSTLARVDARSLRVTGTTVTGASSSAVVLTDGSVWVANAGDSTVQRFQPSTFEQGPIGPGVPVGRQPVALAAGHNALWVVNRADDTVTRIDPSTNANVDTITVGDQPVAVAVGRDAVWVANQGDGTVSRIDPGTNGETDRIEVGNRPSGIAVADGRIWVTVQDAG